MGERQAKRKWRSRHKFRFAPEVTREGKKKDRSKVDPKATSGLRKQHSTLSKHSLICDGKRTVASTSHVTTFLKGKVG